jgi:hypothetical protein
MSESEVVAREDQFLAEADLAVAVLGAFENFIFIDVSSPYGDRATFDAAVAEGKARGFFICGYLRAKDGEPGVMCTDPRGVITMSLAAMAWVQVPPVADYFRQAARVKTGDWDEWAERLYAAPDTRTQWPN